jgi:hypothetical protein
MVDLTLRQIDVWYNEPSQGSDRPKLLSKLAILELCGWLEGEFDRLIIAAQETRLDDNIWVNDNILGRTSGFTYQDHFRPMLCRLVGEVYARRVEEQMNADYPGELDRLKSILGTLWKQRCDFAHADVAANIAAQQVFSAPSWSINQHRIVKKLIDHLELSMLSVLSSV